MAEKKKPDINKVAKEALARGDSRESVQSLAESQGLTLDPSLNPANQTSGTTVQQNQMSDTNVLGGSMGQSVQETTQTGISAPVETAVSEKQTKIDAVVPGSVEYEKLIARGLTPSQIEEQKAKASTKGVQTQEKVTETVQAPAPTQVQPQGEPNYQDNSPERLVEINSNLNKFLAENPTMFSSREAFDRNFKYNQRSAEQRAVLDDFWRGKMATDVAKQDMKFRDVMSDDAIVESFINGSLDNNDLINLQSVNPVRYTEIQAKIDKKQSYDDANNYLSDTKRILEEAGISAAPEVPDLKALYDSLVGTEEIKNLESELNTKKGAIDQLDEEIANITSSMEEQYKGTGMTSGTLAAIIADRTEALNKQKRTLLIDYNTGVNEFNSLRQAGLDEYNIAKEQYELEQTARQAKMQELGFAMNLLSFETPEQKDERERQNMLKMEAFTNGDINSTDPTLRNKAISKAVDTVLAEFEGIPIQRSREQIISDIKGLVDSGVDLGSAITKNLRQPIMNKTEYKNYINSKFSTDNAPFMLGDTAYIRDENGNYRVFNPADGVDVISPTGLGDLSETDLVSQYPNEASFKNNNPTGIKVSISDRTKNLLEAAGISYMEGTKSPEGGNYMKFSSIDEGLRAYEVLLTKAGTDDIYNRLKQRVGTSNGDNYATQIMKEAGISKGEKFSSLSPENLNSLMNAQLKRESRGLYNYLKGKGGAGDATGTSYDPTNADMYALILEKGGLELKRQAEALGVDGSILLQQAKSWRDEKASNDLLPILGIIDTLQEDYPGRESLMSAPVVGYINPELADYDEKFKQLTSTLTLENLINIKSRGATFGSLTEGERQEIANAASSLKRRLSPTEFYNELNRLKEQILLKGGNSLYKKYVGSGTSAGSEGFSAGSGIDYSAIFNFNNQ